MLKKFSMPKFYAVRRGRSTGIYTSWEECERQVLRFPGARFKSFSTSTEADQFMTGDNGGGYRNQLDSRCEPYSSKSDQHGSEYNLRPNQYSSRPNQYSSRPNQYSSRPNQYSSRPNQYSSRPNQYSSRPNRSSSNQYRSYSSSSGGYSGNLATSRTYDPPGQDAARPVVYTDGCCYGNGRSGAEGGVGVYWGSDSPYNVSEKLTGHQTNQRAELTAACKAVEGAISQGLKSVEIRTDSTYTIKAATQWIHKWEKNDWKTVNGDNVKNKPDLERLTSACSRLDVKWTHVPGHTGVRGNEIADHLAKEGSKK